jgi:LPS export ABC transporter protein LptC
MLRLKGLNKFSAHSCALAIGLGIFSLAACENDMAKVAALNRRTSFVEVAHEINADFWQDGKTFAKATLTAPYMIRYNDTPRMEFPRSMHVDFYNDSTYKIESRLDARYGIYYEGQNKVYLRDSVKIVNLAKRDTIYCEDLYWNQNTGKFYTHRRVRIYEPTQVLFGKGMESTQDFANVTIDTLTGTVMMQNGQLP